MREAVRAGGVEAYLSQASFWRPDLMAESAWHEHGPFAFWLVEATRPGTIVELGTYQGFSYFCFCQAVERLGIDASCYAVDTWKGDAHTGFYGDEIFGTVSAYNDAHYASFSHLVRSSFDDALGQFENSSIDLLHIDGRHYYDDVKHDFESWRSKLSDHAIVLFHDTNVKEREFGVFRLWQSLSFDYPAFEFLHGHGLGVLAVGRAIPARVRAFLTASQQDGTACNIREVYARLGRSWQPYSDAKQNEPQKDNSRFDAEIRQLTIEAERPVAERVGREADSKKELSELKRLAEERAAEIVRLAPEAERRAAEWAEREAKLEQEQSELKRLAEERAAEIARLHVLIGQFLSSTSWRVSAPIRAFIRLLTRARMLVGKTLVPVPMYQLERGESRRRATDWKMTGTDPQFALSPLSPPQIRAGHYRLTLWVPAGHENLRSPTIYFDRGAGYSEPDSQRLTFSFSRTGRACAAFSLHADCKALRFDPSVAPGDITIGPARLRRVWRWERYVRLIARLARQRIRGHRDLARYAGLAIRILRRSGLPGIAAALRQHEQQPSDRYAAWIEKHDFNDRRDRAALEKAIEALAEKPLISVVMPVYNTKVNLLDEAIQSVIGQVYPNWELCIADDGSTEPAVQDRLRTWQGTDSRIKVVYRQENGHISACSNSAAELAMGDWIALLDHDDVLPPHALAHVAIAAVGNPDAQMLYSDEDKIDVKGARKEPYFKTDWNYHLFLSQNMFSHLGVYRTSLFRKVSGFRVGFEGAQDYDLALRCVEQIDRGQIIHIPHVLYHWRQMPGSTSLDADEKPYAMAAGERALNEHYKRIGVDATAELIGFGYRRRRSLPENPPDVAIIIPTRDRADLLKTCVTSILAKTTYDSYHIIIVDNASEEAETFEYYNSLRGSDRITIVGYDAPFNFSAICNFGVAQTEAEFVLLLNNDTAVINGDWLEEMVSVALDESVGAVGARLWYPDDRLQHAGLILSPEHIAMNANKFMPRGHNGYFGRATLTHECSAVTAACMLVSRTKYVDVGGFDEVNLPIAYNDVDFCLRLLNAGYKNVCATFAELCHYESATRGLDGDRDPRYSAEREYMSKKWQKALAADACYNPNLENGDDKFLIAL